MADYALLAAVVFFVSVWNTSVGPSGAVTFAAMATILPPFAVVPIHAALESAAAFFRAVLLRDYVDWPFATFFLGGALIGFLAGAPVFTSAPLTENGLRILLGAMILFVTWIRLPHFSGEHWRMGSALGGFGTSFMTLFVGATGPLVTAIIQQRHPDHRKTLGTTAVCMTLQHGGKIVFFGLIGFSFSDYADLLLCLFAAAIAGAWLGRHVLVRVPQGITRSAFKIVVTLLALHLLWSGATAT
jgi:uncharacterized membrane protein YfcA